MHCPTADILFMYLDGELDGTARHSVEAHLASCQHCRQTVRRWDMLQRTVGEVITRRTENHAEVLPENTCAHQTELSSYVSGLLTEQDREVLEQHLRNCDLCLEDVIALHRTLRLLRKDQWLSPPEPLVQRARQAMVDRTHATGIKRLGMVVIQMARRSLQVLEVSGVPESMCLRCISLPTPATAFRGLSEDRALGQAVEIQAEVGVLDLAIRLIREDPETVGGTIQVLKEGQPLSRARVTLRRTGRTIYSQRLSPDGQMNLPRLVPGEYTMSIPQEAIEATVLLSALAEDNP